MARKRKQAAGTRAGAPRRQQTLLEPSASGEVRSAAPFAVTTDGAVFINVSELGQVDPKRLTDRAIFVGAELTGPERRRVRARLKDVSDELCARLVGALRPRRKPVG
jgi:hypothetical protein